MVERAAASGSGDISSGEPIVPGEPALGWTVPTDESGKAPPTSDQFGHQRYVSTIAKLVADAPSGMTIGLFGGYGTGKTWVIRKLAERLNTPGSATRMIEYDAWRYADDEFRRDFLVHLRSELSSKGLLRPGAPEVDAATFRVRTRDIEEQPPELKFGLLAAALRKSLGYVALLTGVGAALGAFATAAVKGWDGLIAGGAAGAALGFLWSIQEAKALLSVPRLSIKSVTESDTPPIELPEEFLRTFNGITAYRDMKQCATLIIALDNLDRCPPEVGMKVLSTVKNFLEPGDAHVFFLIPCDRLALERHLAALFRNRGLPPDVADVDAREYLEKFFNASLTMTPIASSELEQVGLAQLSRMRSMSTVSEEDRQVVAALAATACRRSPRQLATFLNKVSSSLALLAETPDAASQISAPKVAKLVALQEFAPELWERIAEDATLLRRLEADPSGWSAEDTEVHRLLSGFQIQPVEPNEIQLFVQLKLPAESLLVPEFQTVQNAVDDANIAELDRVLLDASEDVLSTVLARVVLPRIRARGASSPLAANPIYAGLHVAGLAKVPRRARTQFLSAIGPAALAAGLARLGPSGAVAVASAGGSHPKTAEIFSVLCSGMGTEVFPDTGALLQALGEATSCIEPSHWAELQSRVVQLLAADISFEERLRPLKSDFKDRIVSSSARSTLVTSFVNRTGDSASLPQLLDSLGRLEAHASLFSVAEVDSVGKKTRELLTARASADPIAAEDFQLLQRTAAFADAAGVKNWEGLQSVVAAYTQTPSDASKPLVVSALCSIDPAVGPATRSESIRFLASVLAGSTSVSVPDACRLVTAELARVSEEFALSVLDAICPTLVPGASAEVWALAVGLSRQVGSWTALNRAGLRIVSTSADQLVPLDEWATGNLEPSEQVQLFAGFIPHLLAPLSQVAIAETAARIASMLVPSAAEGERVQLFERATQMLGKSNVAVSGPSATIVEETLSSAGAAERSAVQSSLIATVTASDFAVAPAVQRLRLEAVRNLDLGDRPLVRQALTGRLSGSSADGLDQCLQLGLALLDVRDARSGTAAELFRAAIEGAAQTEAAEEGGRRLALAEQAWQHMSPEAQLESLADLRSVGAKHSLPEALAGALDRLSGSARAHESDPSARPS